jgi:uncharacterized protein (TIGR02594 family)
MISTLYDLAQRFVGVSEITGDKDNPLIVWWSQLSNPSTEDDETPWCSAFLNGMCWIMRLTRSKSNAARSWLNVGRVINLEDARPGWDVVILDRPPNPASGHVGLFAGLEKKVIHHDWGQEILPSKVHLLAGNQGDAVSVAAFPQSRIIGVRRLEP